MDIRLAGSETFQKEPPLTEEDYKRKFPDLFDPKPKLKPHHMAPTDQDYKKKFPHLFGHLAERDTIPPYDGKGKNPWEEPSSHQEEEEEKAKQFRDTWDKKGPKYEDDRDHLSYLAGKETSAGDIDPELLTTLHIPFGKPDENSHPGGGAAGGGPASVKFSPKDFPNSDFYKPGKKNYKDMPLESGWGNDEAAHIGFRRLSIGS